MAGRVARLRSGIAGQFAARREVWHRDWPGAGRTVDVHVAGLRRKLGDPARAPRWIATVRGQGFRLLTEAYGRPSPR